MISRRGLAGAMAAGFALTALNGCGSSETFRYKMTVEVETPEGLRTGYAVRELQFTDRSSFPFGESRPQISLRGEAVVVDLPDGQVLFALLTSAGGDVDYGARVADREGIWQGAQEGRVVQIWPRPPYPGDPRDHEDYRRGHALQYPMLVRFRDINDPMSVGRVEPDALDVAFGSGVRIKRITAQATSEEMTMRMAQVFSDEFWRLWKSQDEIESRRDGGIVNNPYFRTLKARIGERDFSTEIST